MISLKLKNIAQAWDRFWFEADCEYQWKLFRILIGIWGLSFYLVRSLDLELFFSENGMASEAAIKELFQMGNRLSVLFLNQSVSFLWICNLIYLFTFVFLIFGIYPRIAAFLAFIFHLSFINRNPTTVFGADLIATFYFFYLIGVPKKFPKKETITYAITSVFFRFAQIQLCIIYAYSGLEKLKGKHWWSGEALWDIFGNAQLSRFDFGWTSHFPTFIVLASTATLVWEIYFPALIWVKKLRLPMLFFGATLHLMIGLTMSIPHFAVLMVLIYVLFLESQLSKSILTYLSKKIPFLSKN